VIKKLAVVILIISIVAVAARTEAKQHVKIATIGAVPPIAGIYDKNFPTIGTMKKGRVPSNKAPVFETDFGRLAIAICFDLNFDELKKRYAEQNPDIIVFPAFYHGGLEQAHWAYTNRAYFVSAICVGNLPSEIRNPMGDVVATTSNHFHYIVSTVNLDFGLAI